MDAGNKAEKRPASRDSGPLAIRSSPQAKRTRKSDQGIETVLDFLNLPYQPLLEIPSNQPGLSSITRSASDLWDWRDIKQVDKMDHNPEGYLEEFHQFFSSRILDHPLAVSPPPLPDIDLCIVSEKHAELLLQKTVCWRVNAVLQMLFDSHSGDDEPNVYALPGVSHRPVYSPGLRFGSFMIPDLWCHSFMDIMQKDRPFVVGDVKLARKWNSSLGRSGNNDYEIRYRTALAQVNFYMVKTRCLSAFIVTEQELVAIDRVPGYSGWLKVSRPFIGPRSTSIGLLGLCLRACSTTVSSVEPDNLKEPPPDAYYPREETEPPSSSTKANPSSSSYE